MVYKKFLSLCRLFVHMFLCWAETFKFAFGVCAFDVIFKKLLPRLLLRSFFLMFCSRTFTVPGLMFKTDPFWVHFVSGVREIQFHFSACVQFLHCFIKRLCIPPHWVFLTPLLTISWLYMWVFGFFLFCSMGIYISWSLICKDLQLPPYWLLSFGFLFPLFSFSPHFCLLL